MKIGIVGLGAVGGLLAAGLADTRHEVAGLARGATLQAVRSHGVRVRGGGATRAARLQRLSDDAADLGPQDLVILALKSPSLASVARTIQPLLGPRTVVLPAMNGVPWWFLQNLPAGAEPAERHLTSVDPDGRIAQALPLGRVLGGVVHFSSASPAPGVIERGFGNRMIVGEPAGGGSARVDAVCAALADAGFEAEASDDIRSAVWFKLWGNMTMNPVSALTGATADRILDDPLLHAFVLRAMGEAAEIGARIGCPIGQSGPERMAITRQLGAFKTSMLQDTLAGRPLELDALVGAVHEIGERLGIAMPNIGALLGLARLMASERGLVASGHATNR